MHTLYRGSEAGTPSPSISATSNTPTSPASVSYFPTTTVPCWAFPRDDAPKGMGNLMCLKMSTQQKHCTVQKHCAFKSSQRCLLLHILGHNRPMLCIGFGFTLCIPSCK